MKKQQKSPQTKLWRQLRLQREKYNSNDQQGNSPLLSLKNSNGNSSVNQQQPAKKFNIHKIYAQYKNENDNSNNQYNQDHNQDQLEQSEQVLQSNSQAQHTYERPDYLEYTGYSPKGADRDRGLQAKFGELTNQIQFNFEDSNTNLPARNNSLNQQQGDSNYVQLVKRESKSNKNYNNNQNESRLAQKEQEQYQFRLNKLQKPAPKTRKFSTGQQSIIQQIVDMKNFVASLDFPQSPRNNNTNSHNHTQNLDFQQDQQPMIMSLGSQSNPAIRMLKLSKIKDEVERLQALRLQLARDLASNKEQCLGVVQDGVRGVLAYVVDYYSGKIAQYQHQIQQLKRQIHQLTNKLHSNNQSSPNTNSALKHCRTISYGEQDTPKFAKRLQSQTFFRRFGELEEIEEVGTEAKMKESVKMKESLTKLNENLAIKDKKIKSLQEQIQRLQAELEKSSQQNQNYRLHMQVLEKQNEQLSECQFDYDQKLAQIQLQVKQKVQQAVQQKLKQQTPPKVPVQDYTTSQRKYYLTQIQKLQQQIEQFQQKSLNKQLKLYEQKLKQKQKQLKQRQNYLRQMQENLKSDRIDLEIRVAGIEAREVQLRGKEILVRDRIGELEFKERERDKERDRDRRGAMYGGGPNLSLVSSSGNFNYKLDTENIGNSNNNSINNNKMTQIFQKNNDISLINPNFQQASNTKYDSNDNDNDNEESVNRKRDQRSRKKNHMKKFSGGQLRKISIQQQSPQDQPDQQTPATRPRNHSYTQNTPTANQSPIITPALNFNTTIQSHAFSHTPSPAQNANLTYISSYTQPSEPIGYHHFNVRNGGETGRFGNFRDGREDRWGNFGLGGIEKGGSGLDQKVVELANSTNAYSKNWRNFISNKYNTNGQVSLHGSKQKQRQREFSYQVNKQRNKQGAPKTHQSHIMAQKSSYPYSSIGPKTYTQVGPSMHQNISYRKTATFNNNISITPGTSVNASAPLTVNTNTSGGGKSRVAKSIDKCRLEDLGNKLENLRNQIRKEISQVE